MLMAKQQPGYRRQSLLRINGLTTTTDYSLSRVTS